MLLGCQSTDKTMSYLNTGPISEARFDYDSIKDKTTITWTATLTNETIYNIKDFSVKLDLYNEETLVDTKTYYYSCSVTHGKQYTGTFTFTYNGRIDNIEYNSWTATYTSFWDTYKVWIIISIIIVSVLALIYLICMIILDLELEDAWDSLKDFFEEHGWILFILLIPFGTGIYSLITNNWITSAIVGVAIVALILIILIMHLIKFIIENIMLNMETEAFNDSHRKNTNTKNNKNRKNIENKETSSENDFDSYTVKELKKYCKDNNISNYSTLRKKELINLINSAINTNQNKLGKNKISEITFDDIAGLKTAKQVFKEKVILAFEHKELYEKYGKKIGGGILLYGLPGTGKTMFAEAASNETDSLFIPIKCSDIKSKWYGESESNIKKIFEKANKASKAIIFFDEFEAIGSKRIEDSNNGNNDLVPQILAEMQGVDKKSNAVIVLLLQQTNLGLLIVHFYDLEDLMKKSIFLYHM